MGEKSRKIGITGNLGFIGSHFEKRARDLGYKIKTWDIKKSMDEDIRLIHPNDLKGIDTIFHFAAQAKVPLSIDDPIGTNSHNVDGLLNVLWAAKEAGVRRVVFSSSSSVYGNQDVLPLLEYMTPNPLSPYAIQKLTGEYYCKVFSEIYGLETVSLRYFNVYGEDMPTDGAYSACIAIFLDQAKNNKPLTIFGGKQTRDFTYVKDVVEANLAAMLSEDVGKGEVINIGSGKSYSIDTIANTISGNVEHFPQRSGEPMDTLAEVSKAADVLHWSPSGDLIKWLNSQIS